MTTRLLLAFLFGAAVAGVATWLALRPSGELDSGPLDRAADGATDDPSSVQLPAGSGAADGPRLEGATDATQRMVDLEAENDELRADVVRLEAEVKALKPEPLDPKAFRFGLPESSPTFDQADWTVMAGHVGRIRELMPWLRDLQLGRVEMDPKKLADIQRENGPLAAFAITFAAETHDAYPNGAFTHPAVLANLIRAALLEGQDPLTREQEIAVRTLGDAWVRDMRRAEQALGASAPELAKMVTVVDEKLRFLETVRRTVLTPTQLDLLFDPETQGRFQLDLLSPALVYLAASAPIQATDRADMQTKLVAGLFQHADVTVEDESVFDWVGRQWVDQVPEVLMPRDPKTFEFRYPHIDEIQKRARAQAGAIRSLVASGELSVEQAEKVNGVGMLLFPYILVNGN